MRQLGFIYFFLLRFYFSCLWGLGVAADEPSVINISELQRLYEAKAVWNELDFAQYLFVFRQFCVCSEDILTPKRVLVDKGNNIISVSKINVVEPPSSNSQGVWTVVELFDFIEAAIIGEADILVVNYNEDYGYPTSVEIDYDDQVPNDDVTMRVDNLVFIYESVSFTKMQGELDDAQALWDARDFGQYQFVFTLSCFCPPETVAPKQVVIDEWNNIRRVSTLDGDELPVSDVLTIPQLFNLIQSAIDSEADAINIAYNEYYGYPELIEIDYDYEVADEETFITINDLEEFNPDQIIQEDLDGAKNLWQTQNLQHYVYKFHASCVCDPELTRPIWVEIKDGDIHGAVTVATGTAVSDQVLPSVQTIEELYDSIQDAIDNEESTVSVVYDEQFGYPAQINIDFDAFAFSDDDELSITISDIFDLSDGTLDSVLQEYNIARALWDAEKIDHYIYEVFKNCSSCEHGTVEVIVADNIVTNISSLPLNESISITYGSTIEELFGVILEAIYLNASDVDVIYNYIFGFPETFAIDYDTNVKKDDISVEIYSFFRMDQREELLQALEDAQSLWNLQDIMSYVYDFRQICDCPPPSTDWKHLEVQGGVIVSAVSTTGQPVPDDLFSSLYTIEELFGTIRDAIESNAFEVSVVYNTEVGYPESIYVDFDYRIVNEEFTITIENVTELIVHDFNEARARWEAQDINYYIYDYYRSCPDCHGTVQVIVQDGRVTSVESLDGIDPSEDPVEDSYVDTIDELFEFIQVVIDQDEDEISVIYNDLLGYPEQILIQYYEEEGMGDQLVITVGGLRNLDPYAEIIKELYDAQSLWESSGIRNYSYIFQRVCSCDSLFVIPMQVQVKNGRIVNIRTTDGGPVIDRVKRTVETVDELFVMILDIIISGSSGINVLYNTEFGYPERVWINDEDGEGDEVVITAEELVPIDESPSFANELILARIRWIEQHIQSYIFEYQQTCDCETEYEAPVLVHVVQGSVSNIEAMGRKGVSDVVGKSSYTIDQVFDLLQDAVDKAADTIQVIYDEARGYPRRVTIDYDSSKKGDEITVALHHFMRLPY